MDNLSQCRVALQDAHQEIDRLTSRLIEFIAANAEHVATINRLTTDAAALMHYVGHVAPCQSSYLAGRVSARTVIGGWRSVFDNPPACTCGLDDVLRGIDARKSGRIVTPKDNA
jgi:hypothetical protein